MSDVTELNAVADALPKRPGVKGWAKPNQAHASAYTGASRSHQSMAGWHPIRASADADLQYEREDIVARARDLQRNDGATAAAVIHAADLIVGHRWVLSAKPDYRALGIDQKAARELARAMQREFYAWGMDPRKHCDRRRRQTFAGMLTLMAKQWAGPEGEGLAVLGFRDELKRLELGARYSTCMEVIDPDRFSNPNGQPDSDTLRSGVEIDEDGAPIAAHIRKAHPIEPGFSAKQFEWERVPWENPGGRPIVLHVMDHDRAAQNRGLTRFAPILVAIRQLAQITDAEAANTLLNALFGAFIKTGADPSQIAEALATGDNETDPWGVRSAFYETAPLFLNGIRMPVLAPGDEVQMNTASRTTQPYIDFRAAFLSIVASMTGTSYEQISRDFSRTNYSSARAALNEVWRTVGGRRAQLGQNVADQVYFAVMQEAFDRGYLVEPAGAPAFEDMPGAYCAANWIGPALGSVDPVKDRQASQIGIEMGLTTLEAEAAAEGTDYEDNIEQLAYENELRTANNIAPVNPAIYGVTPASDAPAQAPPAQSATRAR